LDSICGNHVAPAVAERKILREIAARIRIGHAIEEAPVQMGLRMVRRAVRNIIELGIAFHHVGEDVPLDHHEPGRRLRDFGEALVVDIAVHFGGAVIDRIEWIFRVSKLELPVGHRSGDALIRPFEILHRIDTGGDVAIRLQQPKHRLGAEHDIGIDPEQMRELFLGKEFANDVVAAAGDQALAVQMQSAGQTEMSGVERHAEDAGDVVHRHRRDVAGRREQYVHGFKGGRGKHNSDTPSGVAPRHRRCANYAVDVTLRGVRPARVVPSIRNNPAFMQKH
jgi:hypothetical protein